MKKKFIVIVMTVLALCLNTGIFTASAASPCPPHGNLTQYPSTTGWLHDTHEIYVGDENGKPKYDTCYVYGEGITVNIYCDDCKQLIDTYKYERYYHTHHLCK